MGIPQAKRVNLDGGATADRRPAALELVDREVDPIAVEIQKGALDPFLQNEALDVPGFAARHPQQLAIGAAGSPVDAPKDQVEKVGFPTLEALSQHRSGLIEGDRPPQ